MLVNFYGQVHGPESLTKVHDQVSHQQINASLIVLFRQLAITLVDYFSSECEQLAYHDWTFMSKAFRAQSIVPEDFLAWKFVSKDFYKH